MDFSSYKESLKKKGWYFCMKEAWKRIWPLWWVRDPVIIDLIDERRAFHYLKRKYLPMLQQFKEDETEATSIKDYSHTIWVCWLQGEENAPAIVKKCLNSIRKHSSGYEVVVVTNDNLGSLIEISQIITEKLRKKQMQFATYSDYIRLALLAKYGGIWIDATVFLSAPIPDKLTSQPLFCFKVPERSKTLTVASSWFIVANPGNRIILQVKFLFEKYWEKESHLCNYYLFHLFFALVVDFDEANRAMWRNVPFVCNHDEHMLLHRLFETFDAACYGDICNRTFAHKLSYKRKGNGNTDTYYDFILNSAE